MPEIYSNVLNPFELNNNLLELMEKNSSYHLTQVNGQRIFKKNPQSWKGPAPSRSCEIFIGRIPHDCFEDVLVPLFQRAGELYEFRLMINFSGWNRGYAFAMYTNVEDADYAIKMLNLYLIRPSWMLGVCHTINHCRLYISRIPPETPSEEIVRLLYAITDDVLEVRIRRSPQYSSAIVEYQTHKGAALARKKLVAAATLAFGEGARPAVEWSSPTAPPILRLYKEVGYMVDGHVRVARTTDSCDVFGLEPWGRARRLRMIQDAESRALRHRNEPRPNLERELPSPNFVGPNGQDLPNNYPTFAGPNGPVLGLNVGPNPMGPNYSDLLDHLNGLSLGPPNGQQPNPVQYPKPYDPWGLNLLKQL